jgi:hypothetical protein
LNFAIFETPSQKGYSAIGTAVVISGWRNTMGEAIAVKREAVPAIPTEPGIQPHKTILVRT